MYQQYRQHPELNRLIGAVAVSKQFRQTLFRDPKLVLEHACLGYRFDLTAEEAELVARAAHAGDVRQFSLQVWEWMGRDGHIGEKSPRTVSSFEGAATDARTSTVLTLVEEEEKPVIRSFTSEQTTIPLSRRASMKPLILIVDDNEEMARGLGFAFEMEGYRVTLSPDAETAVRLMVMEQPDLILSGVRLPRADGFAFLDVVRQSSEGRDVPFVFVTAEADWRLAVKAKSKGADEYVVKPFRLEDLIGVVRQLTGLAGRAEVGAADEPSGKLAAI